MSRRWRSVLVVAAIGAAVAVGIAYLRYRPLAVEVAEPQRNVKVEVYGLGTIEARVLSKVGFQVAGTLAEIRADQGDRVKAGTVLARLDSATQQARVAQASANLRQAEAALGQARSNVLKAEAVLAKHSEINRRRQDLAKRGTVSAEAAEEAQSDLKVAAAEVAQSGGAVMVADAAVEQARAVLRYEAETLAKHTLVAPYDALVVARNRELGTTLQPGEAAFTLVDPETIWALIYVDEAAAGALRVGQAASVRLRSQPGENFAAKVSRIEIESDRVSEERRINLRCEVCPPAVYLGEQVEALIDTGMIERALLVPQGAVLNYRGEAGTVWTVENGALGRREVRFGRRTLDGKIEIRGGVPEGARVVTRLIDGLRVGRGATLAGGISP